MLEGHYPEIFFVGGCNVIISGTSLIMKSVHIYHQNANIVERTNMFMIHYLSLCSVRITQYVFISKINMFGVFCDVGYPFLFHLI